MSLELYFSNLISTTGATGFVLESDNASVYDPTSSKRKGLLKKERSINVGPPNCPERQVSRDDLNDCSGSSHQSSLVRRKPQQQTEADALKDFYNEVAPGMRPNMKLLSSPTPVSNSSSLLRRGLMTEVLRLTNFEGVQTRFSSSNEQRESFCNFLDAVQEVVCNNSNTGKERKWNCSSDTASSSATRSLGLKELEDNQSSKDAWVSFNDDNFVDKAVAERMWSGSLAA